MFSLQVLCISQAGKEVEQDFWVSCISFTILFLWIFLPLLATAKSSNSSVKKQTKMSCNSVLIFTTKVISLFWISQKMRNKIWCTQLIHVGRAPSKYEHATWIGLKYCGYLGNYSQKLFRSAFGTIQRCSVWVHIGLMDLEITDTSMSGVNMLQRRELKIKELMALLKYVDFVPIILLKGSVRRRWCF